MLPTSEKENRGCTPRNIQTEMMQEPLLILKTTQAKKNQLSQHVNTLNMSETEPEDMVTVHQKSNGNDPTTQGQW